MRSSVLACSLLLLSVPSLAQGKRLWVLRSGGEMVEYDPATFAEKQTVKIPAEVMEAPQNISVNRLGQILFAPPVSLPLSEGDLQSEHKVWIWNGSAATTIDLGVKRAVAATGSNEAVTEMAPSVSLAADGAHLFWFANEARRLQREDVDLSTTTTWHAWQTDLSGGKREDLATVKMPDCRCPTGSCEESCPYGMVWTPEEGVAKFFLVTQFVAGKTEAVYKATTRYQNEDGKWVAYPLDEPFHRVLDAGPEGGVIVEAIPDTACCGWANQSNDQTIARLPGNHKRTVFDEQATYKNADYDVSFFTSNAKVSPEFGYLAMTISATAKANQPIQPSEQGQANPEESKLIRKALEDLPAVAVENVRVIPGRIAFLPHAVVVGWISESEMLLVEDHVLVVYNVATRAARKTNLRVEDAGRVFLR